MTHKTYSEKLRDGRWQKLRLEIFNRDKFTCVRCGAQGEKGASLQVHHKKYFAGFNPWEYDPSFLETLCEGCHKKEHFPEPIKQETPKPEYDYNELDLIRLLFMKGKATLIPQHPNLVSRKYDTAYKFIISELIRFGIKFEARAFQEMYDVVGYNFYNTPDYIPDLEQFLTSENLEVQRFARYIAETELPISQGWAERFGITVEPRPEEISRNVVKVTMSLIMRRLQTIKSQEIARLANNISEEEMSTIQRRVMEINKVMGSVDEERRAWNG